MKKKLLILQAIIMMLAATGCSAEDKGKSVESVDDLPGATIGVQLGTTGDIYASDYEAPEYGSTVERFNKITDAVQALKQSKIDCVIADEQPAIASIETEPGLVILDEPFALEEYAMVVAKDNDELLANINEALVQLKDDGTLDSIIANYIGDDTKGKTPYVSPEGTTYENGTLVVATNAAFKPYEYYDGNEVVGIDIDIIRAIGDILHMDIEIEDIEFDAIISAVSSHKADVGIAGMTMTQERAKSINFSDSYVTSKQVMIVRGDNASFSNIGFVDKVYQNFVQNDRWAYVLSGLKNTLIIALCAVILGVFIGFLVGIVRVAHDKTGVLPILNAICKLYLMIIRGTPAMIQLLIIYYVVFQSVNISKILVAVIAFAINSGAYVAEIIRGGIMSIDEGQTEAGRSLGLNYRQTMIYIILPQAVKNVLPSLANEFITLIKETSICGYIGLMDLTRGGDIIRSQTYEPFLPLIAVALIYLVIVEILTVLVGRWEKSLRKSDR